jgi:membrane carboxypeptidase/penicillin-binding protein
VGYTPDLAVGVWGGFDERRPIGAAGAYIALPSWCDILREYYATRPARDFAEPGGIVAETVCADSGRLATAYCPRVQSEVFSDRTRPTRECDLHSITSADRDGETLLRDLEDASMQARELAPPPASPASDDAAPPR